MRVTIEPPGAVAAGARWRDNGGSWINGGVTINNAYIGEHYLEFSDVPGWLCCVVRNRATQLTHPRRMWIRS